MENANQDSREFYWTSAAVLAVLLVQYVLPPPAPLEPTLDAGWRASLVEQFLRQAQCGIDVVFTYGPWGFLGEPQGNPAIYPWLVFGRLVLALGMGLGAAFVALARIRGRGWRCLWLAGFVMLANPNILEPFLLYAVIFDSEDGPLRRWAVAALVPACALAAHVKLVALPVVAALALVILWDEAFVRRRVPSIFCGLTASYAAFYFAAGQQFASFEPYLRSALSTMTGYSFGMALSGSDVEVAAGALLCIAAPVLYCWRRGVWSKWPARVGGAAWVAAYFFMAFKQAFVRQDSGHLWAGMITFAIPAAMILAVLPGVRARRLVLPLLAAAVVFFGARMAEAGDLDTFVQMRWMAIRDFPAVFRGRAARAEAYRKDLAAWRALEPLPPFPGGVDTIPQDIFALLLNGEDYRPRPVPQSYAVVNEYLARLNANYLASGRAPAFLLFGGDAIDGRNASTEDNLAWQALLERYEPAGFAADYLVLRHAAAAVPARFEKILEATAGWDQDVSLPGGAAGAVWAEIDVQVAPLGRLINFLYRPPDVNLRVLAQGEWREYRLPIPLARAGFLLSPLVEDPMAFALLYRAGAAHPLSPDVTALSVSTGSEGMRCYGPGIGVRLYRMAITPRPVEGMLDEEKLALAESIRPAAAWRVAASTPRIEVNAPSSGSLPASGVNRALEVSFGLRNRCEESEDAFSSIEFRVTFQSRDGQGESVLLQRTLAARGDRDTADSAKMTLPKGAGTLVFSTTPIEGNCKLGAYWSQIR